MQRNLPIKSTTFAAAAALCASVAPGAFAVEGDVIQLTGTLRDFKVSHPDMQYPTKSFGVKRGLVESTLSEDGKPVLNSSINPATGMISGAESFNQWFRDVPGVNVTLPHTISLAEAPDRPGVFYFAREKQLTGDLKYFFPLDNMGYNDMQSTNAGTHNYYFTYELQTEFTYIDPQDRDYALEFKFVGDDDVWVFINGKLAVDIGGVHGQATGSVNLDEAAADLGLEPGGTYNLVLFFAERHTTESNFRIETTLTLKEVPPTIVSPLYD